MENIDKSSKELQDEIFNTMFGGVNGMRKNALEFAKKLEIAQRTDRSGTCWPTFDDYLKYGDMFIQLELKDDIPNI